MYAHHIINNIIPYSYSMFYYVICDCANLGIGLTDEPDGKKAFYPEFSCYDTTDKMFAILLFGFQPTNNHDQSLNDVKSAGPGDVDNTICSSMRQFERYPNFNTDPLFAKWYESSKNHFNNPSKQYQYDIDDMCQRFKTIDMPNIDDDGEYCGTTVQTLDRSLHWFDAQDVYDKFFEKDKMITELLENMQPNKLVQSPFYLNSDCCQMNIYMSETQLDELVLSEDDYNMVFSQN